ncbi:hypothetical protein ACFLWR_03505 [Chloroflexota bacterium]
MTDEELDQFMLDDLMQSEQRERERQESQRDESDLPIEDDETYTIVWGAESSNSILYLSYKRTVVVKNEKDEYFRIVTTGKGFHFGASTYLNVYKPEEEFTLSISDGFDVKFTGIGLFDFEASLSYSKDYGQLGGWEPGSENPHLSLSSTGRRN